MRLFLLAEAYSDGKEWSATFQDQIGVMLKALFHRMGIDEGVLIIKSSVSSVAPIPFSGFFMVMACPLLLLEPAIEIFRSFTGLHSLDQ